MFISATTSLPLSLHTDIHAQHGGVGVEGGGGGWGGWMGERERCQELIIEAHGV